MRPFHRESSEKMPSSASQAAWLELVVTFWIGVTAALAADVSFAEVGLASPMACHRTIKVYQAARLCNRTSIHNLRGSGVVTGQRDPVTGFEAANSASQ